MPDSSYTPLPPSSPTEFAPGRAPAAPNDTPATPWREVLLNNLKTFAASAALLAAVWVVAFLVLRYVPVFGYSPKEAVGFACLAALIGAFFVRSFVPAFGEKTKVAPTTTPQHLDSTREVVETVVFVVVLVLMLKSFVAEAFVIPTGSMAETLYGYQTIAHCPQCGLKFPVNASAEVEGADQPDNRPKIKAPLEACECPNCLFNVKFTGEKGSATNPMPSSGDRVLVAKYVYEFGSGPNRLDVVVFKYPGGGERSFPVNSGPVKGHVPINYIKRLIGLSGETVAIHRGKIYTLRPELSPKYPGDAAVNPLELWQKDYMHVDDKEALALFDQGKFEIVRKSPDVLLAMKRLVYDNDHQAADLNELGDQWQRWVHEGSGWAAAKDRKSFTHEGTGADTAWVRYRHVLRGDSSRPRLITDFMGYNSYSLDTRSKAQAPNAGGELPADARTKALKPNWVGDLIVECAARIERLNGNLVLELSKGPDRFQAVFDLEKRACSLSRVTGGVATLLGEATPSTITKPGQYQLRFANVDDRLTVWVDGRLIFGDGVKYEGAKKVKPTEKNDLEPVSIGTRGAAVTIDKIKVFRDTYYTQGGSSGDWKEGAVDSPEKWSDWEPGTSTYFVQPDHFLCLGDNSPESSDGRNWGLVPRRLLLGKALLVYYPFGRAGRIR